MVVPGKGAACLIVAFWFQFLFHGSMCLLSFLEGQWTCGVSLSRVLSAGNTVCTLQLRYGAHDVHLSGLCRRMYESCALT